MRRILLFLRVINIADDLFFDMFNRLNSPWWEDFKMIHFEPLKGDGFSFMILISALFLFYFKPHYTL